MDPKLCPCEVENHGDKSSVIFACYLFFQISWKISHYVHMTAKDQLKVLARTNITN